MKNCSKGIIKLSTKKALKMGCSASMNKAAFFKRHEFDCNVFHETTKALKVSAGEENTPLILADGNSNATENVSEPKGEELQVKQTHVLIISRESSITSTGSKDYLSHHVRQRTDSLTTGSRKWTSRRDSVPWTTRRHSISGTETRQEGRLIKSVLKTAQIASNGHVLVNRPMKSVTFLDSVTVVTVY